jgi:hypothetical protein
LHEGNELGSLLVSREGNLVSYDDELRNETDRLLLLRDAAARELRNYPGVVGVAPAVRVRHGTFTGELGFRVYVTRKLPSERLLRRELIPRILFGAPTDVHVLPTARQQCCGATRPLLAGLGIRTSPHFEAERGGTIGCFLNIAGSFVALTNQHVLGAVVQDPSVFQPRSKEFVFTCNQIGQSDPELSFKGSMTFAGKETWLDCAAVRLKSTDFVQAVVKIQNSTDGAKAITLPNNVSGSVMVNGAGQVLEIRDAANTLVDTTRLAGTGQPAMNTLVWKVGATSGLTVGFVEVAGGPATFNDGPTPVTVPNQITVRALAGYTHPSNQRVAFSDEGDSGSVYVNTTNQIVGHHHHGTISDQGNSSFGSPFEAVLSQLNATLAPTDGVTRQTLAASNALARELWVGAPLEAHDLDALEQQVRDRLARTPRGRAIISLIDRHAPEILRLVWQSRPVTVVWHRHNGPAFVVLFARALAGTGTPFPTQAGGISRRALLNAMADTLEQRGSGALRAELQQVRPWLFEILANCESLADLCDRVAEHAA